MLGIHRTAGCQHLAHVGQILVCGDEFVWNTKAEAGTPSGVVRLQGPPKLFNNQGVVRRLLTIEHDSPLLGFYGGWVEPDLPVGLSRGRT